MECNREWPANTFWTVDRITSRDRVVRAMKSMTVLLEVRKSRCSSAATPTSVKVMRDQALGLVHMNPGACGHNGRHIVRTLLRFTAECGKISGVQAVELGPRDRRPARWLSFGSARVLASLGLVNVHIDGWSKTRTEHRGYLGFSLEGP